MAYNHGVLNNPCIKYTMLLQLFKYTMLKTHKIWIFFVLDNVDYIYYVWVGSPLLKINIHSKIN